MALDDRGRRVRGGIVHDDYFVGGFNLRHRHPDGWERTAKPGLLIVGWNDE
ncbi:MAG: hypothetical protein JWM59_3647 [Verrucomicrobiales bacterium]|nr:hypothetical protein [Verrucomicrobiales bacterium]